MMRDPYVGNLPSLAVTAKGPRDPWPVLCFLAVVVLPINRLLEGRAGLIWTGLVFGIILLALLSKVARRPAGGIAWMIAAVVAPIGLYSSSLFAKIPERHWLIGLQILIFMAFSAWAARGIFLRSPNAAKASLVALMLSQTASSLAAVGQALGRPIAGVVAVDGRSAGLAGHPNILGMVGGVVIILCIHLLITKRGPRGILFAVAILNAVGIVASGSISSLIAFGLGALVLLSAARVRLRIPFLLAVISCSLLYAVAKVSESFSTVRTPLDRILQVTGQSKKISTWDVRQSTYEFAWQGIQRDPIYGVGLDDAAAASFNQTTVTHNVLLRAWFQGGFGLGLAFIVLYIAFVGMILAAILNGVNALAAGMLTVVVSFSMTSAALQQEYFWMLIAGAWALVESRKGPSKVAAPYSLLPSTSRGQRDASTKG